MIWRRKSGSSLQISKSEGYTTLVYWMLVGAAGWSLANAFISMRAKILTMNDLNVHIGMCFLPLVVLIPSSIYIIRKTLRMKNLLYLIIIMSFFLLSIFVGIGLLRSSYKCDKTVTLISEPGEGIFNLALNDYVSTVYKSGGKTYAGWLPGSLHECLLRERLRKESDSSKKEKLIRNLRVQYARNWQARVVGINSFFFVIAIGMIGLSFAIERKHVQDPAKITEVSSEGHYKSDMNKVTIPREKKISEERPVRSRQEGLLCKECGNTDFEYDDYWKEYTCNKCGWITK